MPDLSKTGKAAQTQLAASLIDGVFATEADWALLEMTESQQNELRGNEALTFYTKRRVIKIADYFGVPIDNVNRLDFKSKCALSDNLQEIYRLHLISGLIRQNNDDHE
jgi:hypothetical protein